MAVKKLTRKRIKRGRLMNKKGQMAMAGPEQRVRQAVNEQRATEVIVQVAKIRRFGVIRMASLLGIYGVLIGLICGVLVFLFAQLFATLVGVAFMGFTLGALSILIYPLVFGGAAFVIGLIFTPLLNLFLKVIGGISLTIEA